MMSMFQKKIIINKFKAIRIVGLCAIAAMVVGFSKPELSGSQTADNHDPYLQMVQEPVR